MKKDSHKQIYLELQRQMLLILKTLDFIVVELKKLKKPEEKQYSDKELFTKAVQLAKKYKKISASILQQKLKIGFARAASLLDQLEDYGLISHE